MPAPKQPWSAGQAFIEVACLCLLTIILLSVIGRFWPTTPIGLLYVTLLGIMEVLIFYIPLLLLVAIFRKLRGWPVWEKAHTIAILVALGMVAMSFFGQWYGDMRSRQVDPIEIPRS